jgi:hypothetical protein
MQLVDSGVEIGILELAGLNVVLLSTIDVSAVTKVVGT